MTFALGDFSYTDVGQPLFHFLVVVMVKFLADSYLVPLVAEKNKNID